MILRIIPSEAERNDGALKSEKVEQASQRFRKDGAVIVEDIVDAAAIVRARQAFDAEYAQFCTEREDVARVGERRFMVTVKLEPPFGDPQLFANPYLLPLLTAALDENFVIGAFGIVCALPTAPAQHVHNDGGTLFRRPDIDRLLPTAAITVAFPLLEMNAVNGTTALWLGSHRDKNLSSDQSHSLGEGTEPTVREGSCMLWDFRLKHGGTPNRGALSRPLLYLTYCRPWFVDHINYDNWKTQNQKQKPLLVSDSFLSSLSEHHRRLLVRGAVATHGLLKYALKDNF
jgi:ectoine hydroxylase-related dioxygenase (phytanoyl-CoA dioxygenase family)